MLARVMFLQLASLSSVLALPAIGALIGDVNTAVLVRDKRDPSRSYMFGGFMPGSGMSAFASSADFAPYYPHRAQGQGPAAWRPEEPATVEQPPERGGAGEQWSHPSDKGEEEDREEEEPVTRPPKKNKKKYRPQQEEDEEEYEKPSRGSGGNAAASFNAWFPIMLGMFPPSGMSGQGGEGFRGASRDAPASHTTVIANSVSNGRSGIASSHAVAYGGSGGGRSNPQGR